MKSYLSLAMFCLLFSSQVMAISEAERILGFAFNAAGMGAYLTQLEADTKRIELEIQEKNARLQVETDQLINSRLKAFYEESIAALKSSYEKYGGTLKLLQAERTRQEKVSELFKLLVKSSDLKHTQAQIVKSTLASYAGMADVLEQAVFGDEPSFEKIKTQCSGEQKQLCAWVTYIERLRELQIKKIENFDQRENVILMTKTSLRLLFEIDQQMSIVQSQMDTIKISIDSYTQSLGEMR